MTEMQAWEHYVGLNWTDRFNDDPNEEEEIDVDLEVDASKLTEEEFDELVERIEELGRKTDFFEDQADFRVNYTYKSDAEYATGFTIKGWFYEPVYDEVIDCLDYYGVNVIGA